MMPVPRIVLPWTWLIIDGDTDTRILADALTAAGCPFDITPTLWVNQERLFGDDLVVGLIDDRLRLRVSAHPAHCGMHHTFVTTLERADTDTDTSTRTPCTCPVLRHTGMLLFQDATTLVKAISAVSARAASVPQRVMGALRGM